MKARFSIALIALVLLLAGCIQPGNYVAYPGTAPAGSTVVATVQEYGYVVEVLSEAPQGPTARPTEKPTQLPSPSPTPTLHQIAPSLTPIPTVVFPTPTPETWNGSPTPVPSAECRLENRDTVALNMRSSYSISAGIVSQLPAGKSAVVSKLYESPSETWAQITYGGKTGWSAVKLGAVNHGTLVGECGKLPREDATVKGPSDKTGLHGIFSADKNQILAVASRLGGFKGTDGNEEIIRLLRARWNDPSRITVWRSLYLLGTIRMDCYPTMGQGNARSTAEAYWDLLYADWQQRGLLEAGLVTYFEVQNECGEFGAWEADYNIRLAELATAKGICLAFYSWPPGHPELSEVPHVKRVLDYTQAHPCRPGMYHAISAHTYWGANSGPWLFGRWRLLLASLGDAYLKTPWLFTEYAYNEGRKPVDCGRFTDDMRQAELVYNTRPEVWAYFAYSVGPGTDWNDITPCLSSIP